jgi:hypothetical protein
VLEPGEEGWLDEHPVGIAVDIYRLEGDARFGPFDVVPFIYDAEGASPKFAAEDVLAEISSRIDGGHGVVNR